MSLPRKNRSSKPGEAQELFEEALNSSDDKYFIHLVGTIGIECLKSLALSTQKRVLVKMLQSMEKKQFIGQYLPWFEEIVRLDIQHKVFTGPGIYQRVIDLLGNLNERKLLNRFQARK